MSAAVPTLPPVKPYRPRTHTVQAPTRPGAR